VQQLSAAQLTVRERPSQPRAARRPSPPMPQAGHWLFASPKLRAPRAKRACTLAPGQHDAHSRGSPPTQTCVHHTPWGPHLRGRPCDGSTGASFTALTSWGRGCKARENSRPLAMSWCHVATQQRSTTWISCRLLSMLYAIASTIYAMCYSILSAGTGLITFWIAGSRFSLKRRSGRN
jgi:hypothetical protein